MFENNHKHVGKSSTALLSNLYTVTNSIAIEYSAGSICNKCLCWHAECGDNKLELP